MLSYKEGVQLLSISNSSSTNQGLISQGSQYGTYSPVQAYQLDQKLDDGVPGTGIVKAVNSNFSNDTTANNCVLTTAATNYNVSSSDTSLCRLLMQI